MIFLIYLGIGVVVAALAVVFMALDQADGPLDMDFVDYLTIGTIGVFAGASWPALILIAPLALIVFLVNLRREKKSS